MVHPVQFRRLDVVSGAGAAPITEDCVFLLDPDLPGYKPRWLTPKRILLVIVMLIIIVFFVYIVLSHACLRTHTSDLMACQKCNKNILICPFGPDSCEQCVQTTNTVTTGTGGCLVMTVKCAASVYPTSVRMVTTGGKIINIPSTQAGLSLPCTARGWTYEGERISSLYCTNPMSQQSPINIDTATVMANPSMIAEQLMYNYMLGDAESMHVSDDEHGWKINFPANPTSSETESHLNGVFKPANVHIHWVGTDVATDGSEHTVDGKHYRAEIHMVFYNSKYGSLENALGKKNGVHVVGIFLEEGANANPTYTQIDMLLTGVPAPLPQDVPGDQMMNIDLSGLLPMDKSYWAYTGSLTTPEYNTCVEWTVMQMPITVTADQMKTLEGLSGTPNVRETQPVTGPVFTSN